MTLPMKVPAPAEPTCGEQAGIDHSLLDIGYSSFFWIGFESIALADLPSETQPRIPCFSFFCRMPFEKKFDRHC